jgi:hypothetical protein
MRWTNRELGIWELCRTRVLWIKGTTPRNADIWTVDVNLGVKVSRPGIWLKTGKHFGFELWLDGDRCLHVHRRPGRCDCWQCIGARLSLGRQPAGWDTGFSRGPEPPEERTEHLSVWLREPCWRCGIKHPQHCDVCPNDPPCADHVCSWGETEKGDG